MIQYDWRQFQCALQTRRCRLAGIGLATVLMLLAGCVTNPVTGESELSLVSPSQEIAIGSQNYQPAVQSQGGRYIVDPDLNAYVNQVGQKLAAVSDRPQLPYEFVVINNGVPNAWALPGGKIAINRGLLTYLDNEAQLAAVLGHEIVHAAARHSAQQMTQGALLGVGAQILTQAGSNTEYGDLIGLGTGLGAAAWQARYSRSHELEADRYGMEYMAKAGYDPQGAVELQETFVELSRQRGTEQDLISGLFASHPPSQERVEANRTKAATLGDGVRNRERFQRAIAQLQRDEDAYKSHEQALQALKDQDLDRALALTEQAIQRQDEENHFWETKGRILALQERFDAAIPAYDRAISLYPEYFSPYLGRGTVQYHRGNLNAAEQDLLTSQQYLENPVSTYMLGEVSLAMGKRAEAIEYYRRVADAGGELGQRAQQRLQQLGVAPQ